MRAQQKVPNEVTRKWNGLRRPTRMQRNDEPITRIPTRLAVVVDRRTCDVEAFCDFPDCQLSRF